MAESAAARHDFVWLDADAAAHARALPGCSAGLSDPGAHLAEWAAAGRPLVLSRQPRELAPGRTLLGLPLPPSAGKHRIAFDVPTSRIARRAPPPPLHAIAPLLPPEWQGTLSALTANADIAATAPRVYGSAAMHALTGVPCLGEQSDLDLLLAPTSRSAALRALDALGAIAARGGRPQLDGEMLDRHGRAASWRELLGDSRQILFKHIAEVGMTSREDFLAGCEAAAA
jgi:phosphoribosyl-dephospho-CoA transferase